ncbi:MAG: tetratricopeptide repeat protein, partial [Candidatus Omnitrophica bacterium]|nr:tetratricopeptide repeat protein [Candidatus Omnitrophota bacterium]
AKIFVQEGKFTKGLEFYDDLINEGSSIAAVAMTNKALLYKEMKDYKQAAKIFQDVSDSGVNTLKILFDLALCLEKSGSNEKAIEAYFNIIYMFPDDNNISNEGENKKYIVKSYFRIAKVYIKMNNIESAINVYKKVIDLNVEEAKIAKIRLKELEDEY